MSDEAKPKKLGRGLSALFGEETEDYAELDKVRTSKTVPVEFLRPGRYQPRHSFDEEALADLVASIKEKGILQPILVRRDSEDRNRYEIIAGERRWRAAQIAQLHQVPIIIKDLSDKDALEVALVENLQRQDLSALEEADGYRRLMDEFAHNQEDLARVVGKSRSHVANMMRLLALPDSVKEMLDSKKLTSGHARALLNAADPEALAKQVIAKGLNVRQTEKLAAGAGVQSRKAKPDAEDEEKDADTRALERDLSNLLGLKVSIKFHGRGGSLTIHYNNVEQLDDVLHRLSNYEVKPEFAAGDGDDVNAALADMSQALGLSETDLLASGEDAIKDISLDDLLDTGDMEAVKPEPDGTKPG